MRDLLGRSIGLPLIIDLSLPDRLHNYFLFFLVLFCNSSNILDEKFILIFQGRKMCECVPIEKQVQYLKYIKIKFQIL